MMSGTSTSIAVAAFAVAAVASLTPTASDEARCESFGWPYFPLQCLSSEAGGVITTVGRVIGIAGEHDLLEPVRMVVARLPSEVVPARAPAETERDQSPLSLSAEAGRIVPVNVSDAAPAPVTDVAVVTIWRGGVPTDYRVPR